MDFSMPVFPILHCLPEFAQIHVIWVIHEHEPSNHLILCHQLLLLPSVFPSFRIFSSKKDSFQIFVLGSQIIGGSASAWVLPINIQGWFPLELTGLISLQFKGLSRVCSSTTIQKHQFFDSQPFLWSNCTSIHDYWKKYNFDYTDLCWQSDASAF